MKAVVKVEMWHLPNFLRIAGLESTSSAMDVGLLFPTDTLAEDFWNEARRKWVEHVAKRRLALGKSGDKT